MSTFQSLFPTSDKIQEILNEEDFNRVFPTVEDYMKYDPTTEMEKLLYWKMISAILISSSGKYANNKDGKFAEEIANNLPSYHNFHPYNRRNLWKKETY